MPFKTTFDTESSSSSTSEGSTSIHQHDFVKLYWDWATAPRTRSSIFLVDMVDVRQFCQRNRIRYMITPRVHNGRTPIQKAKENICHDSSLSTSRRHQSRRQQCDVGLIDNKHDSDCECDKHLGCIPSVPSHPEWLNQNNKSGIRDVLIPPQMFSRTKVRCPADTRHLSGLAAPPFFRGRVDPVKKQLLVDQLPLAPQQNQSLFPVISNTNLPFCGDVDDPLDSEINPNHFCYVTSSSLTLSDSDLFGPHDLTTLPHTADLQCRDAVNLVLPDIRQLTMFSGAVPINHMICQQDSKDTAGLHLSNVHSLACVLPMSVHPDKLQSGYIDDTRDVPIPPQTDLQSDYAMSGQFHAMSPQPERVRPTCHPELSQEPWMVGKFQAVSINKSSVKEPSDMGHHDLCSLQHMPPEGKAFAFVEKEPFRSPSGLASNTHDFRDFEPVLSCFHFAAPGLEPCLQTLQHTTICSGAVPCDNNDVNVFFFGPIMDFSGRATPICDPGYHGACDGVQVLQMLYYAPVAPNRTFDIQFHKALCLGDLAVPSLDYDDRAKIFFSLHQRPALHPLDQTYISTCIEQGGHRWTRQDAHDDDLPDISRHAIDLWPQHYTSSSGAVPVNNHFTPSRFRLFDDDCCLLFDSRQQDVDTHRLQATAYGNRTAGSIRSQPLPAHSVAFYTSNANLYDTSSSDLHTAVPATRVYNRAMPAMSSMLHSLPTIAGPAFVNDLTIQHGPGHMEQQLEGLPSPVFFHERGQALVHTQYDDILNSVHLLETHGIFRRHCHRSQALLDDQQAPCLLFDICHTQHQFRYFPAATSVTWTFKGAPSASLPTPQHSTIYTGTIPIRDHDLPHVLELYPSTISHDLSPPRAIMATLNDHVFFNPFATSAASSSRRFWDVPDLHALLADIQIVSRPTVQELNIRNVLAQQNQHRFDCSHRQVSLKCQPRFFVHRHPDDRSNILTALRLCSLSSSFQMSTVQLHSGTTISAIYPALHLITTSSGAVPRCNTQSRNLYLQKRLILELPFPTIPIYVSMFEEKVYVSLPLRGSTHQLALPRHRNNVVAAPRTLVLKTDSFSCHDWLQEFLETSDSSDPFSLTVALWSEQSHELLPQLPFRGWSQAIYSGGHPAWGKCQVVHMNPNPPFAERCAAALQDDGWLASDEALWFLRKIQEWRSDIAIGPMIQWSPSRDLRHLMATEDQLQCNNHYLTLLLFLVEAHWCAVEVDRRTSPVHVVLIQWPEDLRPMVTLEMSRILQIPPNRMLVTINSDNEVVTMCGWTILYRWYQGFAMQTCLQQLIHVTEQHQDQLDRVIFRSQHHWGRTNATADLCHFATECRRAFMSEYARGCPDTQLPSSVSTTMFVGPTPEYVREASLVPRPPTNREREINWLRTMLIQPAWLTNFELELVLQSVRFQMVDRYIPSPLHFDAESELLEPFTNDLPTVAGYTKVLFFITYHYHWISISGLKHQNRWMLTAAVPDPHSTQLPLLFAAVATILESSPDRIHVQAIATHSPPHLCGWTLLHSLQDHVQMPLVHDTTLLLQRIAVMPNSRIKNLLFEEALATWTRHAPNQALVTFATQVRTFLLAHMDIWSALHKLHFGGMFNPQTDSSTPASWHTVTVATKNKILSKIRAHVQRPFVCPCVKRLTAFVEIDRFIEARGDQALFSAFVKPSPLQWASQFCQENVMPEACSHDKVTEIYLRVPVQSADLIANHIEAIVFQGKVQFSQSQVLVSILDLEAGLRLFRTGRNHPTNALDIGEFCSGAFSGWTQAAKTLENMGYSTNTKFAIDHDPCVATWYSRNFTGDAIAANPDEVFKLRETCFHYREAPITFQTDVDLGWYLLFCEPIEIATASPPCPAFSSASSSAGLEKPEGQVIIDTILKIMLLQPKILVLEEVASLRSHVHFPLILALLNWGNFQVAWQEVTNLEEWLPQSRPRLLLIAIRRCSYGLKHFPCQTWKPNPAGPTSLKQCHCLLQDDTIIQATTAPLDFETAKLYFDPHKIPGATPRSVKDTVRCRLRTEDDRVQCIMASYGFGHEIDATSSSLKGIFGSLIRSQGQIRFLAGPELLWLQGVSVPWKGPLNPRLLNHIVGNAISVPHAVLGLLNAICHFAYLEFETFPHELFRVAMQSCLHAINSDCTVNLEAGTFSIEPKQVPATAPWDAEELYSPELTRVDIIQGNKCRTLFVQPGIRVLPVMTYLFSAHDPESILWLPFNRLGLAIPVVHVDHFCGTHMTFSLPESYRLCFQEQSFHTPASQWTAVLLPDHLIICHVTASTTIADITARVSGDRLTPYQLCSHMLKKWEATSFPCQVIVAQPYEICHAHVDEQFEGVFLDHGDWLQAKLDSAQADLFVHMSHSSGLSDLLWALGWNLCQLQEPHPESSFRQLLLIPSSTQLSVDAIAIRNIMAAHLTTWYIPSSVLPGPNSVKLSLKLWATVVWEGFLPFATPTDIFARAWLAASKFMGPMVEVRSVLRGKRLSPEETFAGYIAPEDYDSPLNRVHLVGVLAGGGSKVDLALRTNQMMTDFLLQSGASSIATPQFVKDLITLAGVTRLQQIMAMTDQDAKLEQLKLTALHYQVSLPEFADLDADVTKKVRRAINKRFPEPTVHHASDFSLPTDLFHDASGAALPNCTDHTQQQGVFLVDSKEALAFRDSHAGVTMPCVMVILGPSCPISDKTCQFCNLPATDTHGIKVVIAACVHRLGTAPAAMLGADQPDIAVESTSVLAFTAWRTEVPDQLWQQLCESPLRTIWKAFTIDPSKNVVSKPWGRSWRSDNAPTDPEHAQSFQVHVRVYSSTTSAILAQSGTQGIFVNPKTADGNTIDPSFAIVWLRDKDRAQALAEAQKIPEQAGLVLSFKGKRGYGLRVPGSVYEEVQGKLNPSLPKQTHIPATCYVKLSPLPHGVTQDDIRVWLEKQALKMRPIRSLAANTWLLAAGHRVDACHYLWGRSTVLIAPVTQNVPSKPTVLAGGARSIPSKNANTTASSSNDHPSRDAWDPWANWNPSLGDNSSRHYFSDSTEPLRTWSSKTSQYSRSSASGSTSQTSEIAIIQGQIRDLTKASKNSQDNEIRLRQEMQTEFSRVRGEMRSQIEASEQSVRSTLDQRIHCLERSLQETNTGMKEGFNAILAKLGGTPADDSSKRLKSDSAMQIEPPS